MFQVSGNEITNIGSYTVSDKSNDTYASAYNEAVKDCLNGKCYQVSKFTNPSTPQPSTQNTSNLVAHFTNMSEYQQDTPESFVANDPNDKPFLN